MESTWDLMTVENQHCQYREKHCHRQVCFKNEARKQFCSGFFRASNAFLVSCQQRCDLPEIRKPKGGVTVLEARARSSLLQDQRQWWPQKKKLLRGQLKGMDSKGWCCV